MATQEISLPLGVQVVVERRSAARTGGRAASRPSAFRAPVLIGLLASFIVAVQTVSWVRLDLFLDPEPSWAPMRLLLCLAVIVIAGAAGVLAASVSVAIARSYMADRHPVPLPLRRSTILALGAAAILIGGLLRLAGIETIPGPLWIDDVSELAPALSLSGGLSDVSSWAYPVPYVAGSWGGSVGTLYLEGFRLCLKLFGTTMAGVRAPAVLAGILSLFTATLLGRAFLPRGGGALAGLVLAGLRWQIIMSHWGWVAMVLAPILDVATLLMLQARRRSLRRFAFLSGAVAGLGAHAYLSAWIGAAGLGLWALWPSVTKESAGRRAQRGALFALGFLLVALPLLLQDPRGRYFARLSANTHSGTGSLGQTLWSSVEATEAALTGPWWTPDPFSRHDLPDRSRLGWVVGVALAAAFLRAVFKPRDEISGFLLASAAAALLSSVVWGPHGTPNSFRYTYLTTATAVAAASGVLWLLSNVRPANRRAAALCVIGAVAIAGALGARDALGVWPIQPATFEGFHGQDSLIGRAAARWDRHGTLEVDMTLAHSPTVVEAVRRYRLDPDADLRPEPPLEGRMTLRIVGPRAHRLESERVVEKVRDGSGTEWALVLGRRTLDSEPGSNRQTQTDATMPAVPAFTALAISQPHP